MHRTFVFLILLTICVPGCHLWGWGKKSPEADSRIVDNFSRTSDEETDDKRDDDLPSGAFAKQNGRSEDPGTGLSSRSREIEKNLGYR